MMYCAGPITPGSDGVHVVWLPHRDCGAAVCTSETAARSVSGKTTVDSGGAVSVVRAGPASRIRRRRPVHVVSVKGQIAAAGRA
jgi:hypothetical protein